jgi:hypothetical protein
MQVFENMKTPLLNSIRHEWTHHQCNCHPNVLKMCWTAGLMHVDTVVVYSHLYVSVCMRVCVCMRTCVCLCACVRMHICVCV